MPARRDEGLTHWRDAPGGRESHPREEHLLPLMVAAGAATGEPAVRKGGTLQRDARSEALDAPVVHDGLAVAYGRLYVTARDGRVLCLD